MMRIFWPLALFVLTLVAVFSQLDRQSRYSPQFSSWIPSQFASFSRTDQLREALSDGQNQIGLAQARALVARRPIPTEHQRLLGLAQLANNQQGEAALTIQRAAKHGWRNQSIQQAMLVLAMKSGDDHQAAMRLAALWALSGDREVLQRYTDSVLDRPAARSHFAKILAGSRWKRKFLTNGPATMSPQTFTETLEDTILAGSVFDCDRLRRALMLIGQPDGSLDIMSTARSVC